MTVQEQVERLQQEVDEFSRCVAGLSPEAFLAKLGRWTPRDIVAHLVGWNRYVIDGSRQIQRGELPFYDRDPGPNYSKVNAALIREYPSPDRQVLLRELEASVAELKAFLRSLPADVWGRDFGVSHQGQQVTIRSTVDDLMADYGHHRRQIEQWIRSSPSGSGP